jgi:Ca-activated chloride channel family protein
MTALREREIARRLAAGPASKPPADLLGRLQADIPDNLELHPELQGGPPRRIERRFYWLSAASLAVALTGGIIALQTMKEPMIADRDGIAAQARQAAEETPSLGMRVEAAAQEEPEPDRRRAQRDSTASEGELQATDFVHPGFVEAASPAAAGEPGSFEAAGSVAGTSEGQPAAVPPQGEDQATGDRRRGASSALAAASPSELRSLKKELPSAEAAGQETAAPAPASPTPGASFEAREVAEREAAPAPRQIPKPKQAPSAPAPQIATPQAATAPSAADAGSDLTLSVPSLPPGGLPAPPAAERSRPAAKKLSEVDSPAPAGVAEPDAPARFAAAGPAPREEKAGSAVAQEALLLGTVVAEDGSPLPGVTVTVLQPGGVVRHAITNGDGSFLVRHLPLGQAEIRFELTGFDTVVLQVKLAAGSRNVGRITLPLAEGMEELLVTSEPSPAGRQARRLALNQEIPKVTAEGGAARRASTGGTAEPNDQPYGDVFFRHTGTNPFVDTEDDRLSTFGLDVDTGSYGIVRRYLHDGHLPPPEALRVEEVVNALDYGDKPPAAGDFALTVEGGRSPFSAGERTRLLRFAVKARKIEAAHRKPAVLTFVVDVSGSMDRENRLGLVKKSLELLLDELKPEDRVGLVVFGSQGRVLLEPSGNLRRLREAIEILRPEGATNAEEGLVLGYELAARYFREEAINRVILCSDGVANVGKTGPESILARIAEAAKRGIELTTLGFGMGNYNDVLMEQLADRGNGRYAYLDTVAEARRMLVENLTGTLQTVAFEARAQVEFNPKAVQSYRLLGYENRAIEDERFRDDTVDGGEIGAGHTVTALYEIKLLQDASPAAVAATLRLRYRPAAAKEFQEVAQTIRVREVASAWQETSPAFRLASLAAEFAEILKESYWARGGDLREVFRRAVALSPAFPEAERVAEFVDLVGKASVLKK